MEDQLARTAEQFPTRRARREAERRLADVNVSRRSSDLGTVSASEPSEHSPAARRRERGLGGETAASAPSSMSPLEATGIVANQAPARSRVAGGEADTAALTAASLEIITAGAGDVPTASISQVEQQEADALRGEGISSNTDPFAVLADLETNTGEVLVGEMFTRRNTRVQALPGEGLPSVSRRHSGRSSRMLPKAGAVGALAVATIAVPMVPNLLQPEEQVPTFASQSILDGLDLADSQVSVETPETLAEVPDAPVRAAIEVSRQSNRDSLSCDASALGANGTLAADSTQIGASLIKPLREGSYRISSTYGTRILFGRLNDHAGLDFAAPAGTPIYAVADGVVEYVGGGKSGRSGMLIIIRHEIDGQIYRTWYGHMYPNGVFAEEGQQVTIGDHIGNVGSYGNSTGPHLHFEVHVDDNLTTMDPEVWLSQLEAEPYTSETIICN